jgi:hypothetical protein
MDVKREFERLDAEYNVKHNELLKQLNNMTLKYNNLKRDIALKHGYTNSVIDALRKGSEVIYTSYEDGSIWLEIGGVLMTDYDDPKEATILNDFETAKDIGFIVEDEAKSGTYHQHYKLADVEKSEATPL